MLPAVSVTVTDFGLKPCRRTLSSAGCPVTRAAGNREAIRSVRLGRPTERHFVQKYLRTFDGRTSDAGDLTREQCLSLCTRPSRRGNESEHCEH